MIFNEEQQFAIDCNDPNILCLAGAGAGKTAVMINRIDRIVNEGVDPKSILALTFTNAAAFEMKQRYCKLNHNTNSSPEFKTFHAFCYSLISKDKLVRQRLGYNNVPEIVTPIELKRLSCTAKLKSGVKLSNDKLFGKSQCSKKEEFQLNVYKKYLNKLLKQNNLITFDMLCYDTSRLFVNDDPCIAIYKDKYKYIFVDEFQDTDPRQWDFVKSFKSASMFIVADVLQSIYKFRGANDEIVKNLSIDENWTVIKLFQNYRSVKKICEFANENSTHGDDAYRIVMNSDKPGGSVNTVELDYLPKGIEFNDSDLGTIADLIDSDEFKGTTAILCRLNSEVSDIKEYLKGRDIEINNDPCPEYIDILRASLSDSYLVEWLSTYLNSEMYGNYLRNISLRGSEYTAKEFIDTYGNVFTISSKLKVISNIRKILKSDKLSCLKAADILSIFKCKKPVEECGDDYKDIIVCVNDILQEVSESSIYVGTIHSAKGLEYDNVILPNVGGSTFNLNNDQNKNLFYVGITRAKTNLVVMYRE